MTRRDFLIGASAVPFFFNKHVEVSTHSLEDELLGIAKPDLFGDGYLLRKEASAAFATMAMAAGKEGIRLQAVSSYRSFDQQAGIWNRKYLRYIEQGLQGKEIISKITQYSSLPGTSRHHWGTEVDIIDAAQKLPADPLNEKYFKGKGRYFRMKKWLDVHAASYGFFEVYTNDPMRTGFRYEPWHFSYKPLSTGYLSTYLGINFKKISEKLGTLKGAPLLTETYFNEYCTLYLLGINPALTR